MLFACFFWMNALPRERKFIFAYELRRRMISHPVAKIKIADNFITPEVVVV